MNNLGSAVRGATTRSSRNPKKRGPSMVQPLETKTMSRGRGRQLRKNARQSPLFAGICRPQSRNLFKIRSELRERSAVGTRIRMTWRSSFWKVISRDEPSLLLGRMSAVTAVRRTFSSVRISQFDGRSSFGSDQSDSRRRAKHGFQNRACRYRSCVHFLRRIFDRIRTRSAGLRLP